MRVHALQYDIRWENKAASQACMNAMLESSPPSTGSLVVTPELGDVGFTLNIEECDPPIPRISGIGQYFGGAIRS